MNNLRKYHYLFMLISLIILFSCGNNNQESESIIFKQVKKPNGLVYQIIAEGKGEGAQEGDKVLINESMSYSDGTLLFSTNQIGQPVQFVLGANQVIDGVDQGVKGMKKGEKRKLIVPPSLSKRSEYPSIISPDSTLYYEIELVDILK